MVKRAVRNFAPEYPENDFEESKVVIVGQKLKFISGKPTEDAVYTTVFVEGDEKWKKFITYEINSKLETEIVINPTSEEQVGKYIVKIVLIDNGSDSKEGPKEYHIT